MPGTDQSGFKVHGKDEMKVLASHFFRADEGAIGRLQSQWNQMKYEISENIKAAIPEEVRNSKTSNILAWFL